MWHVPPNNWEKPMRLSLLTTFCPPIFSFVHPIFLTSLRQCPRGVCPGYFCLEGFVPGWFLPVPPSVRIHPLQQKVKHHFQFQVSYVGLWNFLKCVVICSSPLPLSQTVTPFRIPPYSYFMDNSFTCICMANIKTSKRTSHKNDLQSVAQLPWAKT